MKLAEALLERKNIKEEINDLREGLERNVKVQEGDTPTEEMEELLLTQEEIDAEDPVFRRAHESIATGGSDGAINHDQYIYRPLKGRSKELF